MFDGTPLSEVTTTDVCVPCQEGEHGHCCDVGCECACIGIVCAHCGSINVDVFDDEGPHPGCAEFAPAQTVATCGDCGKTFVVGEEEGDDE